MLALLFKASQLSLFVRKPMSYMTVATHLCNEKEGSHIIEAFNILENKSHKWLHHISKC